MIMESAGTVDKGRVTSDDVHQETTMDSTTFGETGKVDHRNVSSPKKQRKDTVVENVNDDIRDDKNSARLQDDQGELSCDIRQRDDNADEEKEGASLKPTNPVNIRKKDPLAADVVDGPLAVAYQSFCGISSSDGITESRKDTDIDKTAQGMEGEKVKEEISNNPLISSSTQNKDNADARSPYSDIVAAVGTAMQANRLSSLLTISEPDEEDSYSGFYDDDEDDEFDCESYDDDSFEEVDLDDSSTHQNDFSNVGDDYDAQNSATTSHLIAPPPLFAGRFKPRVLFPYCPTLDIREIDEDQAANTEYKQDGGVTRMILNIPRAAKTSTDDESVGADNPTSSPTVASASAEEGDTAPATANRESSESQVDVEDPASTSICSSASSWRTGTNSYSSVGLHTTTSNSIDDNGSRNRENRRNAQRNGQRRQEQQSDTNDPPEPPCPIKIKTYCRVVTALNVTSIMLCAIAGIARFGSGGRFNDAVMFLQSWLFVKEGEVAEDVIAYVTIGTVFYSLGIFGVRRHSAILVDAALLWYACSWVLNVAVWNIQGAILSAAFAFPHWTLEELFAQEEDVTVWEKRQQRKRIMEQLQQEHGLDGDDLARATDVVADMIEWEENPHSRYLMDVFAEAMFQVNAERAATGTPTRDGVDDSSTTGNGRRRRCGCLRRRRRTQRQSDDSAISSPGQAAQQLNNQTVSGSSGDPCQAV